ncbi:glutaredoxin family protein [Virgibacillus xinjiangensis]|uniref:Glutaredoxin family protein n=1 Tax=Virgibacillus xinjiangensis TaxID=393090 RepID=A0ABV7CY78_9BACI
MKVIIYSKSHCPLCDEAKALVSLFQGDYPIELQERDIHAHDGWLEKYQLEIPVIEVDGKQLNCEQISYENLEKLFSQTHVEDE